MSKINIGVDLKTPLHLLSFLAFSEMVESERNFIFVSHEIIGRFDKYIDLLKSYNCIILPLNSNNDILALLEQHVGSKIHVVSVNFPKYQLKIRQARVNLVTINDGLSSYPSLKSMYYNFKRAGRKISFSSLSIKYFGEKLLSKIIPYEEFYLHSSNDLGLNHNYVEALREVLVKSSRALYQGAYNKVLKNKTMVFIGQPLISLGTVSKNDYLDSIALVKALCQSRNWDFVYKPHPFECPKELKLENELVSFDGSMEEFCFLENEIVAVCSFYSTSLISLSEIFNVLAFRLDIPVKNLYFSEKQKVLLSKVGVINNESY
ncbi:polysialyltransferase family glycosyltransferase [Vibrio splendidus]|uniref:polysialyltransferase family glycosyltransferase n=1 Tax=Vibrio splendidus TaxID=29497 RepID=UPI00076AAF1B|nr:polysialyltransferase family glycosyltransferase [Vibrio splendidus]CAH6817320.1 hypothetical protein VCHA34P120_130038 [Vibrio chagasii]